MDLNLRAIISVGTLLIVSFKLIANYQLINYLVGVLISSTIMRLDWISSRLEKNGIGIPAAKIIGKLDKVRVFLERTAPSRPPAVIIRKRLELVLGTYTVDSSGNVVSLNLWRFTLQELTQLSLLTWLWQSAQYFTKWKIETGKWQACCFLLVVLRNVAVTC